MKGVADLPIRGACVLELSSLRGVGNLGMFSAVEAHRLASQLAVVGNIVRRAGIHLEPQEKEQITLKTDFTALERDMQVKRHFANHVRNSSCRTQAR